MGTGYSSGRLRRLERLNLPVKRNPDEIIGFLDDLRHSREWAGEPWLGFGNRRMREGERVECRKEKQPR